MTVVVTARVPDGLAAWAAEYAGRRDVPRAVIVEGALEHFRALCESGVPDLPVRRGQGRPKGEESPAEPAAVEDIRVVAARAAARAKAERERKLAGRGW